MTLHTVHRGQFSWDGVPALDYKPRGGAFVGVTRRVLAPTDSGRPFEVRYFEVAPGGHSSLERHEHGHAVMVLRGEGGALVGKQLLELRPFDLVCVPSGAWHQFRATGDEPLGFL
ncbi:MAG: cupin domain-containing protein, partial [Myxococcota bacterium]